MLRRTTAALFVAVALLTSCGEQLAVPVPIFEPRTAAVLTPPETAIIVLPILISLG